MKISILIEFFHIYFIMASLVCFGSCNGVISKEENLFRTNVIKLNELLIEYENIPDENKVDGMTTIITKNKMRTKSFYEKTAADWRSIDNTLFKLQKSDLLNKWKLDMIFCRSVLCSKLVEIDAKEDTVLKSISAIDEYISNYSRYKLNKWTKKAMRESVFNNYAKVFTPQFSDEENISIIFQMMKAFQFMRQRNYVEAIKIYKNIVINYPTSYLVDNAKIQIKTCKELNDVLLKTSIRGN